MDLPAASFVIVFIGMSGILLWVGLRETLTDIRQWQSSKPRSAPKPEHTKSLWRRAPA